MDSLLWVLGCISFLTNLKVGLIAQKPWNIQIVCLSYSQPFLSLLTRQYSAGCFPFPGLFTGHVAGADTLVMIHTLIFSSQLFSLPRTYYAFQVTLLADADYGPNAQKTIPKGRRAPNNITCFFLYPHKQALLHLFWNLMISKYYTDELFSLGCLTWSYFFRILQQIQIVQSHLRNIFIRFSLWRSLVYSSARENCWRTGSEVSNGAALTRVNDSRMFLTFRSNTEG